jgi:hypothetical protein
MAVDYSGQTISEGDQCLIAGSVRRIDGGTLVITTGKGELAIRVNAADVLRMARTAQYVLSAAGAFTTAAPTSSVAAAPGTNQLTRATEVDAAIDSLIGSVLFLLSLKADAGHAHVGEDVTLDSSSWTGALTSSRPSNVQELANAVDALHP